MTKTKIQKGAKLKFRTNIITNLLFVPSFHWCIQFFGSKAYSNASFHPFMSTFPSF